MVSLRETKKAKTKINLYQACMQLMKDKPYRSVMVDELCALAEISKATFFNFFPQKEDLMLYIMQIWISKRYIEIIQTEKRGISAIRHLFQQVHNEVQSSSSGMLSIISILSESQYIRPVTPFTEVEKQLLFPGVDDSFVPTDLTLFNMFYQYIEEAKLAGEMRDQSDTADLVQIMFTIFYGAFLTAHLVQTKDLITIYEKHLSQLLK